MAGRNFKAVKKKIGHFDSPPNGEAMERLTTNIETELCRHKVMCSGEVVAGKVTRVGLFIITVVKGKNETVKANWT